MASPITHHCAPNAIKPPVDREWLTDMEIYLMLKEADMSEYYAEYQDLRKPHLPAEAIRLLKERLTK